MFRTIPNILTFLRLVAAPGIAIMFLYFDRPFADWYALVLFVLASVTDFFDGYLARKWGQESNLGRMLDPIADKAMVVIALLVITGFSGMRPEILLPATVILFREIFVSGLREFLGADAMLLKVTRLAKWKTTVQMVAIVFLFAQGVFEHYLLLHSAGLDEASLHAIFDYQADDPQNLRFLAHGLQATTLLGVPLLWLAALLTALTGVDYLRKARPYL